MVLASSVRFNSNFGAPKGRNETKKPNIASGRAMYHGFWSTSSFFYSDAINDKWNATTDWYLPSYSVIALDTIGDARPEYIIKTSKFQKEDNITQEDFADNAVGMKIQPYRIEDEARKLKNTTFKVAAPFASYAIADSNLITGQQQNSGAAAARLVVEQLKQ